MTSEVERPEFPVRPNGYITRPELWALDEACKPLRATFPDYGPYLVGSVMEHPTFRDVDVRLILADEQYDRLSDSEWGLFGFITSRHLAAVTGLPIDFQFQRQAEANAAYGHKMRTPLGMRGEGHWEGDQRPATEPKTETDYPFIDVPDALGIAHFFWDEIVMADQHEVPYRRGQYHGCDGIRLWRDDRDYCYLWVEATVDHDMWMAYLLEVRTSTGGVESRDHLYLAAGGGGLFEVEWRNQPITFDSPLDDHIDHHRAAMHWFVERDVSTIEEQNGGAQGIIEARPKTAFRPLGVTTVADFILCVTPKGCTCGAPADTPSGMHHDHCAVNPAEPDGSGCRVCKIAPSVTRAALEAPID